MMSKPKLMLCSIALLLAGSTSQPQADMIGQSLRPAKFLFAAEQSEYSRPGCFCTMEYNPVCAAFPNGKTMTFSNPCRAKCADAKIIHMGFC